LRGFQERLPEFNQRNIRIVGISVDSPATSENLRRKAGYSFLILSDENAQVIRQWDLLHPHAGPDGADIARPAEFLLDGSGKIRWENLTGDIVVRARPQQVLDAADSSHIASN
jgi:peroxiredoxin